ncbi:MAG TPA: M24 family metallopeptidase, partial [Flavobacteriales bacterium]|nr:M24 family metallopeptidase [Flavobacteriales bacterium]
PRAREGLQQQKVNPDDIEAVVGNRVGDIGFAVQSHAEKNGYGVVRELTGHGVGRKLHEGPEVPNFGRRGHGAKLQEGMALAIEPMINMGSREARQLEDGWTVVTLDGKPSAHFEHTVAVRKGKAEVLSTFSYIEDVLKQKGEWVGTATFPA